MIVDKLASHIDVVSFKDDFMFNLDYVQKVWPIDDEAVL